LNGKKDDDDDGGDAEKSNTKNHVWRVLASRWASFRSLLQHDVRLRVTGRERDGPAVLIMSADL
jgi:hypothetical protein